MAKFNAKVSDEQLATLKRYAKSQGLSMTVIFKLWIQELKEKLDAP